MSTENQHDTGFEISATLTKAEGFYHKNKKNLGIGLGALAVLVGGYFGYRTLIIAPMEDEAQGQMFVAQRYFEADSLKKAIDGDGNNVGFKSIVDDYGSTNAGNLAKYYLGLAYLKSGQYEAAIESLKDYSAKDNMTGPLATGAIGDAYIELGNVEEGVSNYLSASKEENSFTAPLFLKKAGSAYESQNKFSEALDLYKKIKKEFPESVEGGEIDKYIARAEARIN